MPAGSFLRLRTKCVPAPRYTALPSLVERGARLEFHTSVTFATPAFGFFQLSATRVPVIAARSDVGAFGGVLSTRDGISTAAVCPAPDTLPTPSIANTA